MYTLPLVRMQNSLQCLLLNGLVGNTSPGEAQQRSKGLATLIPQTGGRGCSERLQKLCVCCPGNICRDHSALKCAYTWVLLPRRGSTRVSLMSELQVTDRVEWVSHSFNCSTSDNATAEKTASKHHYHTAWPTTPLETLSAFKKFLKPLVSDTLKAALLSSATSPHHHHFPLYMATIKTQPQSKETQSNIPPATSTPVFSNIGNGKSPTYMHWQFCNTIT